MISLAAFLHSSTFQMKQWLFYKVVALCVYWAAIAAGTTASVDFLLWTERNWEILLFLSSMMGTYTPEAFLKLHSCCYAVISSDSVLLLHHWGLTSLSEDESYLQELEFGGNLVQMEDLPACLQPLIYPLCVWCVCKTCSWFALNGFVARWTKFGQPGFKIVQIFLSSAHKLH